MKARINVRSYDTSIWRGMQAVNCREQAYTLGVGVSIHTVGLERPYEFKVTDIRPGVVDLLAHPEVSVESSDDHPLVGSLTLDVGDTVTLRTLSLDAWGYWVVTLEGIA
jgi:hypothetical protein